MSIFRSVNLPISKLLRNHNCLKIRPRNVRYFNEEVRDRARALKLGEQLKGYTVQKIEEVPELFVTAVLLQHDKTGAQHLHAARDDDNNVFSVTFRTTPEDSSGVSHILEHTVLSGSVRYPVRDPFMRMVNRSTATFLNAMTAYDWTMYPFSSQNKQDFRNLMSVYMDAVFFPLIREMDFCQEGWRLEHTDPSNQESPVIFKGVVYNEMKGVFSNSQSRYHEEVLNGILPSDTYSIVSGGDPVHIPNLTHQQLKEFHATHYHPSNARFFTYGNFPLEEHLEFIGENLDKFQQISASKSVPLEPRWTEPRSKKIVCPPEPMAADPDKQTTVSVSYLMSDITDVYDNLVNSILCHLLVNGETAPFYQALLEPNIGSDYAVTTGFHNNTRESYFSVGLANIHEKDVDKVLDIISNTVDSVIKDGFEKTRIDALLHRIELDLKHQSSNFGLGMTMSLASLWNHDGDVMESLKLAKCVEQFRQDIKANPGMLQERVQRHFKDNPHRLVVTMSPDASLLEQEEKAEQVRLDKMLSGMDKKQMEVCYQKGLELQESQNKQEDVSCLPSLQVNDLDPKVKQEPVEFAHALDWTIIQTCDQPTNGVTYLRMAGNLEGITEDLLPYVPLFSEVITRIGAGGNDYLWVSKQQELYTGGMSASPLLVPHHTDKGRLQRAVLFSSHCLEKNYLKMLDLWTMIFNSPDFTDHSRLSTLIKMTASDLAGGLSDSGHSFAITSSASSLDINSQLSEVYSGYSQVLLMKQIAEMPDISDVVYKLHSIGDVVLDKSSIRLSLNATPTAMDRMVQGAKHFLTGLQGEAEMTNIFPPVDGITPKSHKTQYQLPFNVNYVAQSYPGVLYTHKDYATLNVLATLMSSKFLHKEIREKGGAYGSGARASSGIYSFHSYRDPNSLKTVDVFGRCIDWAADGKFEDQDVEEAKLRVFQNIDKPVPPGSKGQTRFLFDISEDMRQKNRDRLFQVRKDDLVRVVHKYLKSASVSGTSILGPANTDIQKDDSWTVISESEGESSS